MTGYNVEPVVASESALRAAIDRYYGSTHAIELKKVMEEVSERGLPRSRCSTRSKTSTCEPRDSEPKKRRSSGW